MTAVFTVPHQKARLGSSSQREKSYRTRRQGVEDSRETAELMFEVVMEILGGDGIRVCCWQKGSIDKLEAEGQNLEWLLFRYLV